MNISDEKPKVTTSLDRARLHYVRTDFNKKAITKATIAYLRHTRALRWLIDRF